MLTADIVKPCTVCDSVLCALVVTDVLRECRCENARLINYLSRPEIVMDLVRTTFDLPPLVGPARPDATGSQKSATSTESPQPVSFREQQKEHHLKHAHVASEILTCDNKRLSEAIVADDRVMDKVFSYLELAEPGQLHTVVSTYFAKLMVSLLKTRNTLTTAQMAKRDHFFIATLLKHIDSAHIADLVVHILDSPDAEMSYNSPPTNKRPTAEALDLLAKADIFGGLADCFFRASTDVIETSLATSPPFHESRSDATHADSSPSSDARLGKHPLESKSSERPTQKARSTEEDRKDMGIDLSLLENSNQSPSAAPNDKASVEGMEGAEAGDADRSGEENAVMTDASSGKAGSNDLEDSHAGSLSSAPVQDSQHVFITEVDEERRARRRRLREETMFNVTGSMLGLTERMLQLPELGIEIPDRLSVFATPSVVSRLIDAGIYAKCSGGFDKNATLNGSPSGHLRPSGNYGDADENNAHRIEAFSTGCNSALMHALGLAADLLTTELNVYHDDTEDHEVDGVSSGTSGGGPSRVGSGRSSLYSGKGISGSLGGDGGGGSGNSKVASSGDATSSANASNAAKFLGGKKEGDKLVDTGKLEKELCVRFERLANMFNDGNGAPGGADKLVSATSPSEMRPLGSLRLKLAEFFVACIKHGNEETVQRIIALDVPRTLLHLFEKYRWSSMLHGVVTHAIINCLCGGEVRKYGRMAWFKAGLIPWLINVWSKNTEDNESSPRWGRCGYLGHLIRIGKAIRDFLSTRIESIDSFPVSEDVVQFREFAESKLMPAHDLEETPLCSEGGGNGDVEDEGEEATDVLEMGGIQFVEGLGGGNAPLRIIKYGGMKNDADLDDEGEIKPVDTPFDEDIRTVEVDDLDHFGAEVNEEPSNSSNSASKSSNGSLVQERASMNSEGKRKGSEQKDASTMGFFPGEGSGTKGKTKVEQKSDVNCRKGDQNKPPKLNNGEIRGGRSAESARGGTNSKEAMDFKSDGNKETSVTKEDVVRAVEEAVDSSSSDDEGSYEAFVDDQKDDETNNYKSSSAGGNKFDAGVLAAQVNKLKVEDSTTPLLDGAVTEIDEDGESAVAPSTSDENARSLGRLAENMMRLAAAEQDEDENSSDDEYESWEDASRELRQRQDAADSLVSSLATTDQRSLDVSGPSPQSQPRSRT